MTVTIANQNVGTALGAMTLGRRLGDAAARVTMSLYQAEGDAYFRRLSLAVGDGVTVADEDGTVCFSGGVQTVARTPDTVTVTAYDRGVYLTRNQLYGVFAGTGNDIVRQIAVRLGLSVGTVNADPLYKTIVTRAGQSAFSVLRSAVGDGRRITVEGERLTVTRCGGEPIVLAPERFLTVESCSSVAGMVNRCAVLNPKGDLAARAEHAGDVTAYGQFQTVETLRSGEDAAVQAQSALIGKAMTATVTVLGDLSLRCGGRVAARQPSWGLDGSYDITAVEHRWRAGLFTTELELKESL